jgi:hypothetical protein
LRRAVGDCHLVFVGEYARYDRGTVRVVIND